MGFKNIIFKYIDEYFKNKKIDLNNIKSVQIALDLKDQIIIIDDEILNSNRVKVPFDCKSIKNKELEIYIDGNLKRNIQKINEEFYGDYEIQINGDDYFVQFFNGILSKNSIVRFRLLKLIYSN